MKLLSFDIGIRNLSFCLFNVNNDDKNDISILKWNNVSLVDDNELLCIFEGPKGKCNKPAKYFNNDDCFCAVHSKTSKYIEYKADLMPAKLKKKKLAELKEVANEYGIVCSDKAKKQNILDAVSEFITNNCLLSVSKSNASKTSVVVLARNIVLKLNEILEDLNEIDLVIIENQLDNKMATVQGMIVQYLISRRADINITLINAINKLKDHMNGVTTSFTYYQRKAFGVKVCKQIILEDPRFREWTDLFSKKKKNNNILVKKKDDLADCFLQGFWYIKHNL